MIGRRERRRHRHLRDRKPTLLHSVPSSPSPSPISHPLQPLPPQKTPTAKQPVTFLWPDPDHAASVVVLVASFDGYLHHRMRLSAPAASSRSFVLSMAVPPGNHTYKFLVDGRWSTHPSLHATHPINTTRDGVRHHTIYVPAPVLDRLAASAPCTPAASPPRSAHTSAVFRSASSSAVPKNAPLHDRLDPPVTHAVPRQNASASLVHEQPLKKEQIAPRGASFNAPPPAPTISNIRAANRKSLLQRVGYGWLRRFSTRPDNMTAPIPAVSSPVMVRRNPSDNNLASLVQQRTADRGLSPLYPNSSEPVSTRTDKENSFASNRHTFNDRLSKRGTLRNSTRSNATVSRPSHVDQPRDVAEVNLKAENWRQMARYLQEHLSDPSGARELYRKAIEHREVHGLRVTTQNAQVHVDLARSLSKSEQAVEAESHLRTALEIYEQTDPGKEHVADLVLYVGVLVDRQKRRTEAEQFYQKALLMYKQYRIRGSNVDIAFKNLSLCLRKQNRDEEILPLRKELYEWKCRGTPR